MTNGLEPISFNFQLIGSRANYAIFVVFEKYGDRRCSWLYQNHWKISSREYLNEQIRME